MKVYALGDSHMQALGPRLQAHFSELHYEAFPGKGTAAAGALRDDSVSGKDVVILALGGNDFGDRAVERRVLLDSLRARNPKAAFYWIGPFHSTRADVDPRHLRQSNDQRAQFAGSFVKWIDSRPWTATHAPDGVHFTGSGYTELAKKIANSVSAPRSMENNTLVALAGYAVVGLLVAWWYRRSQT
jgi:lysophospholipase L1-like esterase